MSRKKFVPQNPFVFQNEGGLYYVAAVPKSRETANLTEATVFDERDNRELKGRFLSALHKCEFKAVEFPKS